MKIKVCGMKYHENIKEVADLDIDYLGFIFYRNSERNFDGIIPTLASTLKKVGVFVNSPIEKVVDNINKYNLDAIQLHGNESVDYCKEINKIKAIQLQKDLDIIKVFSLDESFDFDQLLPYEDHCDYFLFDTKGPLPGGNGYAFDWEILQKNPSKKEFFLSGGIGMDSIEKIQGFFKSKSSKYCKAIDVNSKMEIKPGLKNPEILKQFIKTIKNFD